MPWRLMHPIPALADTVRYPQPARPASQPGLLHLLSPSKIEAPYRYFTFRPSAWSIRLLCPQLTSVHPSRHLSMPLALTADRQTSPGNAHPPSRLCPPHLRLCFPYRYRTLKILAFSSSTAAFYAIPVRRTSALPSASFRSHLTTDTLAVRLTVPPVGPVEDLHLQVSAPCRAHQIKRAAPEGTALTIVSTCSWLESPRQVVPEGVVKTVRKPSTDFQLLFKGYLRLA